MYNGDNSVYIYIYVCIYVIYASMYTLCMSNICKLGDYIIFWFHRVSMEL